MIRLLLMAVAVLLVSVSNPVLGAGFLHIESIPGESQDPEHQGWIELLSVSAGRQTESSIEFTVAKTLDTASAKVAEAVSKGKVFPTVLLDVESSDGILRTTMVNVLIVSYSVSGAAQSDSPPVEDFTLRAESAATDTGGKVKRGSKDRKEKTSKDKASKKDRETKTQ